MSEFHKLSQRFSMYIYIQNTQGNLGTKPVYSFEYKLQFFMESLVKNAPLQSEDRWARFFLKILLDAHKTLHCFKFNLNFPTTYHLCLLWSLSNSCLICYLQLLGYYSARQIHNSFKSSPNLTTKYPLEELLAIASETALKPAKLLRNFCFDTSFPVYGYAQQALYRAIQNQVAKELKTKALKSTHQALLRNTSGRQLKQALISYGVNPDQIIYYHLAWQCFVELSDTHDFTKQSPNLKNQLLNAQQLTSISSRYQQQLIRISHKNNHFDISNLESILTICIRAIQSYQNKQIVSLEDERYVGKSFDIADTVIEGDRGKKINELREIIKLEFNKLDKIAQISLLLWLGLDLNQGELLFILNLQQQYQVSRKFKNYQKNLLKGVTKTYLKQEDSEDLNLSEKALNEICYQNLTVIKDCLNVYAKEFFNGILEEIIQKKIKRAEKKVLQKKLEPTIIEKIQALFAKTIEVKLQISLNQLKNIDCYIAKFIDRWLKQNRAVLFT